tara:strand:- start:17373 stop:18536 length:1164 start_codon:yes stop_codon:yes gene_type:complete
VEFSENVTILEDGEKTYYIIGTAHISQKSVEEVQDVIDAVQPDTVCVELCETRYKSLTDESVWKKLNIFDVIRQGKTLYLLAHIALSMYQRRMGEQFGVKPGAELMAALEKADEVGAELVLADRDVQTTLRRTWANLGFFQKITMMMGLFMSMFEKQEFSEEELEQLKEQEQLSGMLDALATEFPQVKESLIDERDKYLISSIEKAPGKKIVAVVGAGHVPGMKRQFKQSVDISKLDELPAPSKWVGTLKWIIPAVVIGLFVYGYQSKSGQDLQTMLYAWILPNAIMCALLAALAGAKFLTIITGAIASPITSLNPAIGAGVVTGLVEAWLRKPTVEDCERINEDIVSFSGIYKNAFTRVLLVAVLSNFGSALGAWIGISWLIRLFV